MKKKIIIGISVILLFGCGEKLPKISIKKAISQIQQIPPFTVEKPDFSIKLPGTWKETHPSRVNSNSFLNFNAIALFHPKNEGIRKTKTFFVATKEKVRKNTSLLEFFLGTRQNEKESFYDFVLLSEANIQISNQDTKILAFTAKVEPDSDSLHYWQTFLIRGENAFVFSLGTTEKINANTKKFIKNIFTSIHLK